MPITRIDHFTVLTKDATATAEFYRSILGMEIGPRPNLTVRGVWLYCEGAPLLHVIEKEEIPEGSGVLDHVAFGGSDLSGLVAKLAAHKVAYELTRFPSGGASAGDWQLFFRDPNGARVEVDLPASEPDPARSKLGAASRDFLSVHGTYRKLNVGFRSAELVTVMARPFQSSAER